MSGNVLAMTDCEGKNVKKKFNIFKQFKYTLNRFKEGSVEDRNNHSSVVRTSMVNSSMRINNQYSKSHNNLFTLYNKVKQATQEYLENKKNLDTASSMI